MTDLTLDVYTSPMLELPNGGMFSPTTSTLVLGETEVVLVDTPYLAEHIEQVIQRIEASGRRLTTVFITHGHSDHYFGLERLLAHFPQASAVSVASVAAHVESNLEADRGFTRDFFAGAAVDNTRSVRLPLMATCCSSTASSSGSSRSSKPISPQLRSSISRPSMR